MTTFDDAKNRATSQHVEWSSAERQRLTEDRDVLAQAIKSGAIHNLAKADRDALIDAFGQPAAAKVSSCPNIRADRMPRPLAPGQRPSSPRQSWLRGELAYAIQRAVIYWAVLLGLGIIALNLLWYRDH
jgi:hypothetical protein